MICDCVEFIMVYVHSRTYIWRMRMATDKSDAVTRKLPGVEPVMEVKVENAGLILDSDETQWVKVSLMNQIKSLERMMAKYPAGSGAFNAHQQDVSKIRKILERL